MSFFGNLFSSDKKKPPLFSGATEIEEDRIPILRLGSHTLTYEDSKWQLKDSKEMILERDVEILQSKNRDLEASIEAVTSSLHDTTDKYNEVVLKNKILIEMLAVAQLDQKKCAQELETARNKYLDLLKSVESMQIGSADMDHPMDG